MPPCPDLDLLVALARLSADPVALARHVADCPECGRSVATLSTVRLALEETTAPDAGFTDEVMANLAPAPAVLPWRLAGGLLGALTAVLVSAASGVAAVPGVGGPTVWVGALLAGAAAMALPGRPSPSRATPT